MKVIHSQDADLPGKKAPPEFSKARQKEIDKRLARYMAFNNRFSTGLYIRVQLVKSLIAGLIEDREKHPYFNIHHKINFGGCVKAYFTTKNNI